MKKNRNVPYLLFASDWTERDDFETPLKGYRNDVLVELPDKRKFAVSFYDVVRLRQVIEDEKMIAEIGLIILDEVTKTRMEEAVYKLWRENYFEHFKTR